MRLPGLTTVTRSRIRCQLPAARGDGITLKLALVVTLAGAFNLKVVLQFEPVPVVANGSPCRNFKLPQTPVARAVQVALHLIDSDLDFKRQFQAHLTDLRVAGGHHRETTWKLAQPVLGVALAAVVFSEPAPAASKVKLTAACPGQRCQCHWQ